MGATACRAQLLVQALAPSALECHRKSAHYVPTSVGGSLAQCTCKLSFHTIRNPQPAKYSRISIRNRSTDLDSRSYRRPSRAEFSADARDPHPPTLLVNGLLRTGQPTAVFVAVTRYLYVTSATGPFRSKPGHTGRPDATQTPTKLAENTENDR